ncbi:MAG: hypothetical protein ABI678_01690, partial [Kofleriaceae bacterium]
MGSETRFVDLRRLADWFATDPTRPSLHVEKNVFRQLPNRERRCYCPEMLTSDENIRDAFSRLHLVKMPSDETEQRIEVIVIACRSDHCKDQHRRDPKLPAQGLKL